MNAIPGWRGWRREYCACCANGWGKVEGVCRRTRKDGSSLLKKSFDVCDNLFHTSLLLGF
jgi:hypothetical protein